MSTEAILLTVFGTLLTAIVGLGTALIAASQSKAAAREAHMIENNSQRLAEYDTLLDDYRVEIQRIPEMRGEIRNLQAARERDHRNFQVARDQDHRRMTRIETQARLAVSYIKQLVAQIQALGHTPEPPPADLDLGPTAEELEAGDG